MKVDLSVRDIEFILMLLSDSAAIDEIATEMEQIFSIEELTLIEKLESALRKNETGEKELLDSSGSNLFH